MAITRGERNRSLQCQNRKHTPLPTGPLNTVACRDLMTGFSKKGGVLVRLYYPAAKQTKRGVAEQHLLWPNWLPHENYRRGYCEAGNIMGGLQWEPLIRFFANINGDAFIPVIPNAKPLKARTPYPVIVFSHGLGGCRTTYSGICAELASHGFVVAAVEHRDNTACLSFYAKQVLYNMRDSNPNFFSNEAVDGAEDEPDFGDEIDDPNYIPPKALSAVASIPHITMEWVRYRNVAISKTGRKIYAFRNKQIHHRVRECSRALDLLEALQAGYELNNILDPLFDISEFEGLLDLNKAVIMGHSMGGATSIMCAATELRFKVAVCLDAWMYPIKDELFDLVTQPILFVNCERDQTEPNLEKISELLLSDNAAAADGNGDNSRKAVTIKGSIHFNQCDLPFITGWFTKWLLGWRSKRNRFTVHDITNALSLQFISKHLDIPISGEIEEYLTAQKKKLKPSVNTRKR